MLVKPIAIYLPQFHPIPENDEWWGKGFTEWTNVTRAKPLFKGHDQPHLPADLGFYDLRLEETRLAQEKMAKKYGIEAFCYYHYWFNGKRVLEEPLTRKIKNPKEDLPFMICWANENWTKVWDGADKNILLEQEYCQEDFQTHIKSLIPILQDSRYLTLNGKKVIAIYSPQRILEIDDLIKIWKDVTKENNIELDIINFISFGGFDQDFNNKFDFSVDFEPHSSINQYKKVQEFGDTHLLHKVLFKLGIQLRHKDGNNIIDFQKFNSAKKQNDSFKVSNGIIPCVIPGFDNSARKRKNYLILNNNSPEKFRNQVKYTLSLLKKKENENLIFINAWNEWAEGNHLEPCKKWGTKYLEVLKEEIDDFNNNL
jgi:lipopolysaccharide biosynthesis protein